jgi:predicted nuclease of predicted toxin-antitoxin system
VADAPVIVWLRLGNSTNATLRVWLEPRLSGMIDLIESGHRLVEVI